MTSTEIQKNYDQFINSNFNFFLSHTKSFDVLEGQRSKSYVDEYNHIRKKKIQYRDRHEFISKKHIKKNPVMGCVTSLNFEELDLQLNLKNHWYESILFTWFMFRTQNSNSLFENWYASYENITKDDKEFYIILNLMRQMEIIDYTNDSIIVKFHTNLENSIDPYIKKFPYSKDIKFDDNLNLQIMQLNYKNLSGWLREELFKTVSTLKPTVHINFNKIVSYFDSTLKFIVHHTLPLLQILTNVKSNFLIESGNSDFIIRTIIFECTNVFFQPNHFTYGSLFSVSGKTFENLLINIDKIEKEPVELSFPNMTYEIEKNNNLSSLNLDETLQNFEQQNRYFQIVYLDEKLKLKLKELKAKDTKPQKYRELFNTLENNIMISNTLIKEIELLLEDIAKISFSSIDGDDFVNNRLSIFVINFENKLSNCKLITHNLKYIKTLQSIKSDIKCMFFLRTEKEFEVIIENIINSLKNLKNFFETFHDTNKSNKNNAQDTKSIFLKICLKDKSTNFINEYFIYRICDFFINCDSLRINIYDKLYQLGNIKSFRMTSHSFDEKNNESEHLYSESISHFNNLMEDIQEIFNFYNLSKRYNNEFYESLIQDLKKSSFTIDTHDYLNDDLQNILFEDGDINLYFFLKSFYKIMIYILISQELINDENFKSNFEFFMYSFKSFLIDTNISSAI